MFENVMESVGALAQEDWFLVLAAVIPAIALCVYVFIKDRVEKEPLPLLLLLLGAGVLITFPAAALERAIGPLIESIFLPLATTVTDGVQTVHVLPDFLFKVFAAVDNVVGVALIEEGLKWIALVLLTRKSKNFNCMFDGIVFSVFVSLGFAAWENIMYTFSYGFEVALRRAFTAVPAHMFFGVIMGLAYSLWKLATVTNQLEQGLAAKGTIYMHHPIRKNEYLATSIVAPILVHGFYDYVLSVDGWFYEVLFYVFLFALYVFCFYQVSVKSEQDGSFVGYATAIMVKKYNLVVKNENT